MTEIEKIARELVDKFNESHGLPSDYDDIGTEHQRAWRNVATQVQRMILEARIDEIRGLRWYLDGSCSERLNEISSENNDKRIAELTKEMEGV